MGIVLLPGGSGSFRAGPVFDEAAQAHQVPKDWLLAVTEQQANFNSAALQCDPNGAHDIDRMQNNSGWLPTLRCHGLTAQAVCLRAKGATSSATIRAAASH